MASEEPADPFSQTGQVASRWLLLLQAARAGRNAALCGEVSTIERVSWFRPEHRSQPQVGLGGTGGGAAFSLNLPAEWPAAFLLWTLAPPRSLWSSCQKRSGWLPGVRDIGTLGLLLRPLGCSSPALPCPQPLAQPGQNGGGNGRGEGALELRAPAFPGSCSSGEASGSPKWLPGWLPHPRCCCSSSWKESSFAVYGEAADGLLSPPAGLANREPLIPDQGGFQAAKHKQLRRFIPTFVGSGIFHPSPFNS